MPRPQLHRWLVTGDTPLLVNALMVDRLLAPLLIANVTGIELRIFLGDEQQNQTATITPASSMFDTLQTTSPWEATDGAGFNFQYTIASNLFYRGTQAVTYRAEFKFNTNSASTGPVYLRGWIEVDPALSLI